MTTQDSAGTAKARDVVVMGLPVTLSIPEAAREIGVSARTCARLCRLGLIPHYRGQWRRVRIPLLSLIHCASEWAQKQTEVGRLGRDRAGQP